MAEEFKEVGPGQVIEVMQSPQVEGAKKTLAAAVLIPKTDGLGSNAFSPSEVTPQLKLMARLIAEKPKDNTTELKDAKDLVAQPAGKAVVFTEGLPDKENVFGKGCVVLTAPTVFGEGADLKMTTYVAVDAAGVFAIQGKNGATYPEGTFQKHMESILDGVGNQENNFVINRPNLRIDQDLQILPLSLEDEAGKSTMRILGIAAKASEANPLVTSRDVQIFNERNRPAAPIVEETSTINVDEVTL